MRESVPSMRHKSNTLCEFNIIAVASVYTVHSAKCREREYIGSQKTESTWAELALRSAKIYYDA